MKRTGEETETQKESKKLRKIQIGNEKGSKKEMK
jgi:hypothetical protein